MLEFLFQLAKDFIRFIFRNIEKVVFELVIL